MGAKYTVGICKEIEQGKVFKADMRIISDILK
jgi:hypothetical protein